MVTRSYYRRRFCHPLASAARRPCHLDEQGREEAAMSRRLADVAVMLIAIVGLPARMAAPNLVKNGDWPQPRNALEQRYHLAVPNRRQRIAPSAAARRFLLRRQPRILFDAISSGNAEPGLGRGNTRHLGLAETHVQPHLAIGDVAAGQAAVPHRREEPASYPADRDRQQIRPLAGPRRSPDSDFSRATPTFRHASGDSFSS